MGHIFRSMALAEYLRFNFEIRFVLANSSDLAFNMIRFNGYAVDHLPPNSDKSASIIALKHLLSVSSAIVSDSYNFDTEYQIELRKTGIKIVCIDDLAKFPFACDVIINHNPHIGEYDYKIIGKKPEFCLGLDYALIRKDFLDERTKGKRPDHSILICIGGTDHIGFGIRLLTLISKITIRPITVHYITTSSNIRLEEIAGKIESLNSERTEEVHLHVDQDAMQMRRLMLESSVIFSTPSTVTLEAIACRLPVIAAATAANQESLAMALANMNLIRYLGPTGEIRDEDILYEVSSFFTRHCDISDLLERQRTALDLKSPIRYVQTFQKLFTQEMK